MRVCYGMIGEIVFILFIGKQIWDGIKERKNKNGIFILLLFTVFAMHAYTLEVFYSPTISYTLPLFYYYISQKNLYNSKL